MSHLDAETAHGSTRVGDDLVLETGHVLRVVEVRDSGPLGALYGDDDSPRLVEADWDQVTDYCAAERTPEKRPDGLLKASDPSGTWPPGETQPGDVSTGGNA